MRTGNDTRPSPSSLDYVERVNRAIDHIVSNLEQPLRLERLARVACFSPFHFHRVFRALMGETLDAFVRRVRLERALFLMARDRRRSLTEIALACGFGSSSEFSRAFKRRYGLPPSAFDVDSFRAQRREELQSSFSAAETPHRLERLQAGENPDGFAVELRQLPARRVAYIRVLDPFADARVVDAAERLVAWAESRGVADGQWLGYMWDDPEIVALPDCRYDVGLEIEEVTAEGEIGQIGFPAMLVAQLEVRGSIDLEQRALDWLFGTWLPSSGYLPTEHPCFEAWIGRPFAHGLEHFELHVQLPVARS